jgi:hypothetical protein
LGKKFYNSLKTGKFFFFSIPKIKCIAQGGSAKFSRQSSSAGCALDWLTERQAAWALASAVNVLLVG